MSSKIINSKIIRSPNLEFDNYKTDNSYMSLPRKSLKTNDSLKLLKIDLNIKNNNGLKITDISDNSHNKNSYKDSLLRFTEKYNNSNWCDYCLENKFIHMRSQYKFIDKCVAKHKKLGLNFFKNPYSHMLGSLLSLNFTAKFYLNSIDEELHEHYIKNINDNHSNEFIIYGIINQYIDRVYITDIKLTKDKSRIKNRDNWLKFNNIRCENCNFLACPFHHDHGNFEINDTNDKIKYCCGWCIDILTCDSSVCSTETEVLDDNYQENISLDNIFNLDVEN